MTLEHLKATLRRKILDKCKIDKKSVIVKTCPDHSTELLNKSPYNQIPENAADSPPVSTLSVGAAATSSIQNFGDGGGPGTETKLGKSSAPPSLVSSGSGQQQACIMANQLQAAAAARGMQVATARDVTPSLTMPPSYPYYVSLVRGPPRANKPWRTLPQRLSVF